MEAISSLSCFCFFFFWYLFLSTHAFTLAQLKLFYVCEKYVLYWCSKIGEKIEWDFLSESKTTELFCQGEGALFCLLLWPWNYSFVVVLVSGTEWRVPLMSFRLPESLYLQGTFFSKRGYCWCVFVCFRSCIKYYKQNPLDEQHVFQLPVRPTAVKSLYQRSAI